MKKEERLTMGSLLISIENTHVVNGSVVPDDEILWMPLDSKLQIKSQLMND